MLDDYLKLPLEQFVKRYPYDNKYELTRNVELLDDRTNIRKLKPCVVKKQKAKKVEPIREVKKSEYMLKDEDWET